MKKLGMARLVRMNETGVLKALGRYRERVDVRSARRRNTARVGGVAGSSRCAKRPGWCVLKNSFDRTNPLIDLTAEEYKDLAYALVSYVALHATVDQTTYFMSLYRYYTLEIAGKVAVANKAGRGAPQNAIAGALKTSLSH